jgi:hypothetical protein
MGRGGCLHADDSSNSGHKAAVFGAAATIIWLPVPLLYQFIIEVATHHMDLPILGAVHSRPVHVPARTSWCWYGAHRSRLALPVPVVWQTWDERQQHVVQKHGMLYHTRILSPNMSYSAGSTPSACVQAKTHGAMHCVVIAALYLAHSACSSLTHPHDALNHGAHLHAGSSNVCVAAVGSFLHYVCTQSASCAVQGAQSIAARRQPHHAFIRWQPEPAAHVAHTQAASAQVLLLGQLLMPPHCCQAGTLVPAQGSSTVIDTRHGLGCAPSGWRLQMTHAKQWHTTSQP